MNTLKGIIEDLNSNKTKIGGCTTKGEVIIMLKSMALRLKNAIEFNEYTTNGEMFIKTFKPYKVIEYEHHVHAYATKKDFESAENQIVYSKDWWNSLYQKKE